MRTGAILSTGLHAGVIALAWFGLPHLRADPPELDAIVFVRLADLGEVTNLPPEEAAPARNEPRPEPKPPPPRPAPPRAAAAPPPPAPPPAPAPEPRRAALAPPAPAAAPPARPEPEPAPRPAPKPAAAPKPAPRPKPRPAAAPAPPTPRPKAPAPERGFAALLKDLKRDTAPPAPKPREREKTLLERAREAARAGSDRDYDPSRPVTLSEIEAVRRQIARCWNVAAGARRAEALAVEIEMTMNPDATVREARVADRARMDSDPFYRAAAESALRAIRHTDCVPLDLPLDKYKAWKSFTFNFDPKDMLR